jgi:hypothetical protein
LAHCTVADENKLAISAQHAMQLLLRRGGRLLGISLTFFTFKKILIQTKKNERHEKNEVERLFILNHDGDERCSKLFTP